jgi:hypothetical protein
VLLIDVADEVLKGELVTLPDGELKVAGLEESALAGGQTILVDAGKNLFGRASDDAALRLQARRNESSGEESASDEDDVADGPFCGRRISVFILKEEKQVQWIALKSIIGRLQFAFTRLS